VKGIIAIALLGACSYSLTGGGLFHSGGGSTSSTPGGGGGGGGASALVHGGGGNQPFAATATSGPDAWKRYELKGIQLGMSRKQLKDMGFTCGERANQRCWKIIDDRCKTGVCKFKEDVTWGEQWFELNGNKATLDYITCRTTETDAALVDECRLQVSPRQVLAADSTLGKALIAKYGEPVEKTAADTSDPEGGGRLLWWNPELGNNGPEVDADCTSEIEAVSGKYLQKQCRITVSDDGVRKMALEKQADIDAQRKKAAQPTTAPQL